MKNFSFFYFGGTSGDISKYFFKNIFSTTLHHPKNTVFEVKLTSFEVVLWVQKVGSLYRPYIGPKIWSKMDQKLTKFGSMEIDVFMTKFCKKFVQFLSS